MKASYSSIKQDAKSAMSGHIGEVILVGLVLPIAFSMIASFFNGFFEMIYWGIPPVLSIFTGAITTYITLRMVIKIVRYNSDSIFNNFLGSRKGIIHSMLFAILSLLISFGYIIIFWDYFILIWDLIKIMPADYFASDPDALTAWLDNQVIDVPSSLSIILALVYTIFIMIFSVRISFTTYVIADSDLTVIEAIKKSWKITKGNWWRIVIFPLSFILWIFAMIFTLGLASIYVIPYIAIARGAFYDRLLLESGEVKPDTNKKPMVRESVTDETALDEDDTIFDKKDPFENYYE